MVLESKSKEGGLVCLLVLLYISHQLIGSVFFLYVQEEIKRIHERTRKVKKISPTHYVPLNTQKVLQMWMHT